MGGIKLLRFSLLLDKYIQGDFGQVSSRAKLLKDKISQLKSDKISCLMKLKKSFLTNSMI